MKEILNEWRKFVTEGAQRIINMELDLATDSIILYHVGWMRPGKPFGVHSKHMFTGEPEIMRGMTRPLGNKALYFSTNKESAFAYKKYSELSYLYRVRFPISKIAGGQSTDPLGITRRNEITLPKEEAEYFFKQAAENLNSDYKARFQVVNDGLEIGVYDASLIEILDVQRLFNDDDVAKWFDENIRKSLDDYLGARRLPDGRYEVPNSGMGIADTIDRDELIEYLEGDIEDILEAKDIPSKKKAGLQEFKSIFPNEFENYKTSLLKVLERIKQGG
jgi:hypothetical protein